MSNNRKGFTHIELTDKFDFFKTLDIHKFYEAINTSRNNEENTTVCRDNIYSSVDDPDVITFLKKHFCISKCSKVTQEFFVDNINSKEKQCVYFRYWLYDKLLINGFNEHQINILLDFVDKNKDNFQKIFKLHNSCNFYKLSLKEIHDIKSIYDYIELFLETETKNYKKIVKHKDFLSYIKKGLGLYKSSTFGCPSVSSNAYCNEFNEYRKIYANDKAQSSFLSCQEKLLTSLHNEDTSFIEESLHTDEKQDDTLEPGLKKLLEKDKINEILPLNKYYELLTNNNNPQANSNCDVLEGYRIKEKDTICKLWGSIENILQNWDTKFAKFEQLDSEKLCYYFNYWLYHKLRYIKALPCDVDMIYFLWNEFIDKKAKGKKTCHHTSYYGFNKEQLGNKKKLFHFLEYFDKIKDKMKDVDNKNQKDYCDYIQSMFELYKAMVNNNASNEYTEELSLFKKKFWSNNEVPFLEKKCPHMCLNLVFDEKYKTLCPLDEKPSVTDEKADLNICEIAELSNINPEISKNYEKEYSFEDLNTYSVYNKLNREVITDNYYSFCSKLLPFSSKNCGIYGLCVKLARNIKDLSYMKNKERIARCEYIIHWMFDKIRKILKIDTNNNYDTKALNEFFKVGYDIFHKLGVSDCLYNTTNVNFDEQKEIKNLHDYFKDFDKISCDNATNSTKCEKYCEYVQYINSLYGEYIDNCCYCFKSGGCMDRCPDYFKCDDIYNPHNLFEKLKCKNIQKFNEGMKKVDKPPFADHYVTWLTEHFGKEKEKPLLKLEEKELSITPKMESSSTPEKVCDKITCDPFYVSALGVLGLMGFLLISFILYKITPLGSYFHNKDARKKKTHFQQSEEQLLEDDFEFNRTNMKNRRLRLAYHQA
ncbi:PIR Superfamily Protein [Plasmodium ovale curtisi]|uniref:PIR Superfamily Protein n=1 Tax=Plasmodium ovale curtisi TaxID=864141 RepID=A0A1A8X7U3_PLAOA|nr:PIR Superfamily Protein [Plasmodium ovale curtisi]